MLGASRAAVNRYLLPAGPTAANAPHAAAAVDSWDRQTDRQTDGRTPHRDIDPAPVPVTTARCYHVVLYHAKCSISCVTCDFYRRQLALRPMREPRRRM